MDWDDAKFNVEDMPLDILMDEQKLLEFREMFFSHIEVLKQKKKDAEKELRQIEVGINYMKDKHSTISGYIQFLSYGGHAFVKKVFDQNKHVVNDTEKKIFDNMFSYKICGEQMEVTEDGWHVCIRKFSHKGKCSSTKVDKEGGGGKFS